MGTELQMLRYECSEWHFALNFQSAVYGNTLRLLDGPLSLYFWDLFLDHVRVIEARAFQAGSAEVIYIGKHF